MFDRIAGRYDLMNSAMTAGLHHKWRSRAADLAELPVGGSALDVCCGTGDLALELSRRVGPSGEIIGCDFSEQMLDLARAKNQAAASSASAESTAASSASRPGAAGEGAVAGDAEAPPGFPGVTFEWADALNLPYEDSRFDAVTVGFGVRNLADLQKGIGEMGRVLKPGGRLVILEITRPTRQPLASFYSLWFDRIVPGLGSLSGEDSAYSYLPESVRRFPAPEKLAELIANAGMTSIRWSLLAGGIIAIHSATRPG